VNRHEAKATVERTRDDAAFLEHVREDPVTRDINLAIHARTCGNDKCSRCWFVVVLDCVPIRSESRLNWAGRSGEERQTHIQLELHSVMTTGSPAAAFLVDGSALSTPPSPPTAASLPPPP
jgi:hypothetical protein